MPLFGGSTVGGAVVELFLKDQSFTSGLAKADAKLNAFGKSTGVAGAGFSAFGTAAVAGFAIAGAAAVAFAASSIKSYEEHEVALAKLQTAVDNSATIFDKSTAAMQDQATALQNLTGFQDEEVLSAQAVLTQFNLTAAQLQTLTPLVLDFARATNTDATSAAESIGKALLGNARALKAVGISYKATGNSAEDLSRIITLLTDKVGGQAEAFGQTGAGQLAIFQANVDDLKEAIGEGLVPVLTQLVRTATPVLQSLAQNAQGAGEAYQFYFDVQSNNERVEREAAAEHEATAAALYDETQAARIAIGVHEGLTAATKDTGVQTHLTGKIMGEFTSASDFVKWEHKSVDALTGVESALSDLAGQSKVTARGILKAFSDQVAAQQNYKHNWDTLLARGAPKSLLLQLQDMGLEGKRVLNALANANDDQFDKIIGKWVQSQGIAKDTADDVSGIGRAVKVLPNGKTIFVYANITQAQDALNSIERRLKGTVTISGQANFSQHGFEGITTKPTMFVTSEYNQPEHVSITPGTSAKEGRGGGTTVIVNVHGDVNGIDDFERKVGSAMAKMFGGSDR